MHAATADARSAQTSGNGPATATRIQICMGSPMHIFCKPWSDGSLGSGQAGPPPAPLLCAAMRAITQTFRRLSSQLYTCTRCRCACRHLGLLHPNLCAVDGFARWAPCRLRVHHSFYKKCGCPLMRCCASGAVWAIFSWIAPCIAVDMLHPSSPLPRPGWPSPRRLRVSCIIRISFSSFNFRRFPQRPHRNQ